MNNYLDSIKTKADIKKYNYPHLVYNLANDYLPVKDKNDIDRVDTLKEFRIGIFDSESIEYYYSRNEIYPFEEYWYSRYINPLISMLIAMLPQIAFWSFNNIIKKKKLNNIMNNSIR